MVSSSALAWVWNQKHLDYGGCANTCHNLHGSALGDSLLVGSDTESTCRGCHGVAGPGPEAAIHDPLNVGIGNMGYITCRECHDSYHDEDSVAGGDNVKMVGYDWDPIVDPGKSNVFPNAKIRVELSTTNPIDPPVYKSVVFNSRSTDFSRGDFQGVCQTCHNTSSPAGPPSGSSTDLNNHQWGDCTVCHLHSEGFAKLQCVDCHDVNFSVATTAPKVLDKSGASVANIGTHLQSAAGENIVFPAATRDRDWTIQCIKCHTGHSGDVTIPNNATVGIDYQKTGGIWLGGSVAAGTSEAAICWGCHDTRTGGAVSEWNALADHGFTVTGGSDWTSVSFDLAGTRVPTKTTTAIHSVNATLAESISSSVTNNINWATDNSIKATASKVLEDVADIRCSYCHDVHGTFGGVTTDASPYLRGTWLHNPYVASAIERPPESGDSWTGNRWSHFDSADTVPRIRTDTAGANQVGGFQIDQNNGFPTAGETLSSTAGLCVLCHGSDVDTMDYFNTQNLWLGANGHSNAALGGSGSQGVNLFDARNRDGQLSTAMGFYMAGQGADNVPNDSRWGKQSISGIGERRNVLPYGRNGDSANPDKGNSGTAPPRNTGYYGGTAGALARGAGYSAWYSGTGIGSSGSASGRAHDFSCSKCHTPHASGMPALLVTNCLDYTISNWSASGQNNSGQTITIGPTATNRWALETMNNCHRKKSSTTGWNRLAPGQ